jgi:hypothetical protein
MAQEFDVKYAVVLAISVTALAFSILAWRNSSRLANDAFTPKLAFSDLALSATFPDDLEAEETLLHYKMQNQGRLPMKNLHIAEVVTASSEKKVKQESREVTSFDPGDPVDSVTYLTPTVIVPADFNPESVASGKIPFSIQFETESSTERIPRFTTCTKFNFNHYTGKFDRALSCTPEVFK